MTMLRALGSAEIETGVTTLTPSQGILFAAALYLILERGRPVSRARLASILWPLVAEEGRAHRLRQTILRLKKVGFVVTADRNTLQCSRARSTATCGSLEPMRMALAFTTSGVLARVQPDIFRSLSGLGGRSARRDERGCDEAARDRDEQSEDKRRLADLRPLREAMPQARSIQRISRAGTSRSQRNAGGQDAGNPNT